MRIGSRITNPGELNTPITLQGRALVTDAGGTQSYTYSKLTNGDVWAKWRNVHGEEAWASQAVHAISAATVTIRWRSDVDHNTRILKGTEIYEIVSPDNIEDRDEYLELKVKKVTGSA
jgi:SPP1 family predicted phage head-tail adaptor